MYVCRQVLILILPIDWSLLTPMVGRMLNLYLTFYFLHWFDYAIADLGEICFKRFQRANPFQPFHVIVCLLFVELPISC